MVRSDLCRKFYNSLELAIELITLDNYNEPPSKDELSVVQGIRGGAAILMVAAFENFIEELPLTYINIISKDCKKFDYSKFPQIMQTTNVYRSLKLSMKIPKGSNKFKRLNSIHKTIKDLLDEKFIPEAFILQGNPKSTKIINIYRFLGIDDIFKEITTDFQKKWGKLLPTQIIKDKLDEIVNRRNIVAHTTNALKITIKMLREALIYLLILAELLDNVYKFKIEDLCTFAILA